MQCATLEQVLHLIIVIVFDSNSQVVFNVMTIHHQHHKIPPIDNVSHQNIITSPTSSSSTALSPEDAKCLMIHLNIPTLPEQLTQFQIYSLMLPLNILSLLKPHTNYWMNLMKYLP